MKRLALILTAVLCLVACGEMDKSYFPVNEMVSIVNGSIVNDNGVKYRATNIDITEMSKHERVLVEGRACLPEDPDAPYDYELEISGYYEVTIQDAVKASASEEGWGDSPIMVNKAWFANGYLNILVAVSYQKGTGYKGEINLVYDDVSSTKDNIIFNIVNKQEGKTWANEEMTEGDIEFGMTYYSFKYLDLLPADAKGDITATLNWIWFEGNYNIESSLPSHKTVNRSDSCDIYLE